MCDSPCPSHQRSPVGSTDTPVSAPQITDVPSVIGPLVGDNPGPPDPSISPLHANSAKPSCTVLELKQTEGANSPVGVVPGEPYPFLVPVHHQAAVLQPFLAQAQPHLQLHPPQLDPEKESERLATNLLVLIRNVFPDFQDEAEKIVGQIIQEYDIPTLQLISVSPPHFVKIVGETLLRLHSTPEASQGPREEEEEQNKADSASFLQLEEADAKNQPPTDDQSTAETDRDGETRNRVPLFKRGKTDADTNSSPSPIQLLNPSSSPSTAIPLSSAAAGPSLASPVQAGPPSGLEQTGLSPGLAQAGPPPGLAQAGPPPGLAQAGPPPGLAQPGPPPGLAQAGPPPGLAQPGLSPRFPFQQLVYPGQHQQLGQPIVQQGPGGLQYLVPIYPGGFGLPGQYPQQPSQQPGQYPQQPSQYPQQLGQHPQQPSQQPGQYPQQPGQYLQQPGQYPQQLGQYPGLPGQFPVLPGQHPGFPFQPGLPGQPQFNPFAAQIGPIPTSTGFIPCSNLQQPPPPLPSFQQQVAQTLNTDPFQRQVPPSPSLTNTDGQTTPSDDSTESDSTDDQLSLRDEVGSSSQIPGTSPIAEAASNTPSSNQPDPLLKVAHSAPGLRVTTSGLPTAPPGLRVPWKRGPTPIDADTGNISSGQLFGSATLPSNPPVRDIPSNAENSTLPGSLPKVALSAPGLPVSLSGLPTAPPGLRIPWQRVRTDTDIADHFVDPATPIESILSDRQSSPSPGLPIASFSWSQVVRGSQTDIPSDPSTNREQVFDQPIRTDEHSTDQINFFWSSDNLDPDFSDTESTGSSTMSKRRRNPSESGPEKADVMRDVAAVPEFEARLLDSEVVEIQRHAVMCLATSYPEPVGDNDLNRAIKMSRGKGVSPLEKYLKLFADVITRPKDQQGSSGKSSILTDKGVRYAKMLGFKVEDKVVVSTIPGVSQYEKHLTNAELVDIQRHAVKALALVYPKPESSKRLNKAIKTSRGRQTVVEELGLGSLEDCLKHSKRVIVAFAKGPTGSTKMSFVLNQKGVQYARLLGCKIQEKPALAMAMPLRSQVFTRGSGNVAAGGPAQLFMDDDDDFPELGAEPKKKDPLKPDFDFLNESVLMSEDKTARRAGQAQGGVFKHSTPFNLSNPLVASPVGTYNLGGECRSGVQMSGDFKIPSNPSAMSHYSAAPPTYSQLKERQARSASPASTTSSRTSEPAKKTDFMSDFTYHPEEVSTGSMGKSLMDTRHLTKQNLEAIAEECIDRLSNADVLVTPKAVECRILDYTGRSNWNELRVPGIHRVEMLESVRKLQRMQGKVSSYVQTFVSVRSIATLHDLSQCMKEFITDDGTFDNLKLGPISAQPTIREYFNLPSGSPVLEISSPMVIEHLRDYINKNNLWTTPVDLKNFLEYLQEEYGTDTPYELGVRMKSLPLAMQMLKKAQRDHGRTIRECVNHMKELMEKEVKSGFDNFKSKFLLENTDGDGYVIRKYYLELGPAEVLGDIFGKFNVLLQFMLQFNASVKSRTLQRLQQAAQEFVKQVRGDGVGLRLFQLSVCVSAHEIQESLQAFIEKMFPAKGGHRDDDDESGHQMAVNPPPKLDDLLSKFRHNLERCIGVSGTLTLEYLAAIEKRLCENFDHQFFNTMGQGSFLAFLLHQPNAKKIFEELGGNNLTAGGSSSDGKNSLYRPSQGDLVDLVHQCGIKEEAESLESTSQLEAAVCSHYKVSQVQGAGHGPVSRILGVVKRQKHGHTRDHNVVYESALCLGSRYSEHSIPSAEKHAGILGSQTEEAALLHLEACPLLENLETWSQWSLVFQPQFGPLKTFIQKHGGIKTQQTSSGQTYSTTIQALETEPGVLIKITAQTSIDMFRQSAMAGDVSAACGHLVSLVVVNKGLKTMSMELLANHMQSALFTMNSESGSVDDNGGYKQTSIPKVVHFIRECLCRVPIRMCEAVANQIFLEPLSHVLGGTTSKKQILESCSTSDQTSRIYLVGMLLGIDTWSKCYQDQLNRAQQSIMSARTERKKKESFSDLLDDSTPVESEDEEAESDLDDGPVDPWLESDTDSLLSDVEQEIEKKDVAEPREEVMGKEEVVTMETVETALEEADVKTEVKEEDVDEQPRSDQVNEEEAEVKERENEVKEEEALISPEDAKLTPKERECKKVVDQIRKEEFGIGILLNEDAEKLMKVQQERLGRSLDRLSCDLYSKDTHFVLELVQNADDNTYPPPDPARKRSSGPAIRFIVDTDCVTVLNNECGFEEKNIRALCDVGRSTKGKHKFGYIGQKGIGFKSVFRVTDKPEVHSSGYHICFDVESGPMGYILPHWIEDETPETTNRWTTKIVLKLKDELDMSKGHQQTRTLANRFHDVHPSLLLFLHRLRSIVVENKVDNVISKMARRDIGENIIEIKHNTGTDKWLVTKKLLDASKISPKGKSGTDIESTEIALAFPLQGKDKGSLKYRPPQQPVFAFLPLRSYGFRFIVQGDFEVPSSREDVDSDSSWNQGLLDAIPLLFIEALDTFKMQPELSALDAVNAYLQFVPMENETLDFFKSVASNIHQMLKSKPCLPTEPDEEGNVEWKLPSQMVICPDPLIQQVISADMLEQHLGLFYLHHAVMSAGNTPLLQSLGIKQISTQHLLEIGKSLAKQWLEEDVDVRIPSIARWLVCVYRSLNEYSTNVEELKVLKNLAVIPLSKGQLVALDASTVFFPLQMEKAKTNMTDPLRYIEQDLNTLDPRLLTCLDHIPNSQIEKILEQCDVRQLRAHDVIQHHIMPAFKSDEWKHKSRELLCAYVVYIKHHVSKDRSILSMDELRGVIQVDTNQGMKNPATEPVHFTPAYQNHIDLQHMLPGCHWVLLSSAYMPPKPSLQDISQWRDFFTKIGVLDFLAVTPKTVTLTLEELRESPWSGYASLLPDQTGPFTIEDYVCEELTSLLTSASQNKYVEMQTLFQILDVLFNKEFEQFTKTQLSFPGSLRPVAVETSFSLSLKQSAWVPVIVVKYSDRIETEQVLMKGNEVYLRLKKIEEILDQHVPYLSVKFSPESTFRSFLKMHSSLSIDEILEFLVGWCQRDGDTPKCFITSMDHVLRIYEFLRSSLSMQRIKDMFSDHPIIFLPKKPGPSHVPSEGEFWYRHEVCWEDPKGLFTKFGNELRECHCEIQCPQTLCHVYQGQFQTLFCSPDFGAVRQAPLWKEYVGLLTFIASYYPDSSAVLSDVLSIFEILGREFSSVAENVADCMGSELRRLIGKDKVFPTKAKSWASIEDKPMIVDKEPFFKWFSVKPGAHFLELDEISEGPKRRKKGKRVAPIYNKDHVQTFLNTCRIPTLSSCIATMLTTEMYNLCPDLQEFMWRTMPLLQVYLYNMYPDRYETLQRDKVAAKLKIMRFASVGKLEVVYSLKHSDTAVHIQSEVCAMDEWSTFYIHKDYIAAVLEIQKEIARVFSDEDQEIRNGIRTFLTDINQMTKERNVVTSEMICQIKDWEALPDTEERWEVEQPVRRLPPVPKLPPKPKEPEVTPGVEEEGKENKMKIDGPFLSQWPPPAPSGRKTGDSQPGGGLTTMWPPPKHSDDIPPFARPPTADGPREPGTSDCQEGAVFTRSESVQSAGTTGVGGGDSSRPREDRPPGDQVGERDSGGGHGLGGGGGPWRGEGDGLPSSGSASGHGKPDPSGRSLGDYITKAINQTQEDNTSSVKAENMEDSESANVEEPSASSQAPEQTDAEESGQETRRPRTISTGANGAFGTPPRDTGLRSSHEGTPSRGFIKMGEGIEEEIVFDDLGDLSVSNLPHEIRIESSDDAEEVGRIGEQLVYDFLKKQETFNGAIIVEVVWINRHRESGDPYDILVKLRDDGGGLNEVFIEVKATKTDHKITMGMSLRELDFASEKQQRYYLYRVFNIGENKKPRLVSINNIKEKLDRKVIRLCMICPDKIAQGHGAKVGPVNGEAPSPGNETVSAGAQSSILGQQSLMLSFQGIEPSGFGQGQGHGLLSTAMFAALPPANMKHALGERLFPLIASKHGEQAGKITGMLLELDNAILLRMLEDREVLSKKVEEAVMMLAAHQVKHC